MKNIDKTYLTENQKKLILKMFFGKYKDEWKDENGIVDNTDDTIAKRLGLLNITVSRFIYNTLNKRHEEFLKTINQREAENLIE